MEATAPAQGLQSSRIRLVLKRLGITLNQLVDQLGGLSPSLEWINRQFIQDVLDDHTENLDTDRVTELHTRMRSLLALSSKKPTGLQHIVERTQSEQT